MRPRTKGATSIKTVFHVGHWRGPGGTTSMDIESSPIVKEFIVGFEVDWTVSVTYVLCISLAEGTRSPTS